MLWIIGFWATISKMSTIKNTGFWNSFVDWTFFYISTERLSSKPINHTIFCKNSMKYFMWILPKLWQIFYCYQKKYKKLAIFDILKTITLDLNMTTRQMNPFFWYTFWALSVGIFNFCISRSSKFNSMGLWSVLVSHAKENIFRSVNIDLYFLCKTC